MPDVRRDPCVAAPMPISGLVIRMNSAPAELHEQIAQDARITLGPSQHAGFQPAVLETATLHESEAVVEALLSCKGILGVEVVSVDFSDCVYPTGEP